jgi:hypothetical protein
MAFPTYPDISITAGAHDPPHPFMKMGQHGFLIDLSRVAGALWDPTVESITWCKGLDGRMGGRVTLKNGTGRNFFDSNLLTPYVNAWKAKRKELLKPADGP